MFSASAGGWGSEGEPGVGLSDEAAVRALYGQLMEGWNAGRAETFAAPFAEDGDLVAFDGGHFRGREEIISFHRPLFERWLRGTRLVGRVESVRFLSPEVAVMHCVGGTVARGQSSSRPERDSIQTLVASKSGGQWRLSAFHNTRVRPISGSTASLLLWSFSDLLWRFLLRRSRSEA